MPRSRILIVRLPCRKVFPTGPVYLLSLLRRASPDSSLHLLDLALVAPRERPGALQAAIRERRPDLVAFSWRDMQIFSPQDLDGGLRDAFIFFHDPSPARRLGAAFRGLRDILTYRSGISENLALIRTALRAGPGVPVALGGPSVKIFSDWLTGRLPAEVTMFPERGLERFFRLADLPVPEDPLEPAVDLGFLEEAFPQWPSYRDETIGVQSKQGCPHSCLYCLYGFLEGRKVLRREPLRVASEISAYARRWGMRKFWFADSQMLSEPADRGHLASILESMLRDKLDLQWGGYLRIHEIDRELGSLMVRSGLADLEVSLNSGAQEVVDELRLGFTIEQAMEGFRVLKDCGYAGRVLLNLSLNAPGETVNTLRQTLRVVEELRGMFGAGRVVPVIFFLAIQPHTGLESRALADGHLRKGYNPLSVFPGHLLKLIYNPPPLGGMIGRSCARAFAAGGGADMILSFLEKETEEALRCRAP